MNIILIVLAIIALIFAIALITRVKARLFITGAKGKKFTVNLTMKILWKKIEINLLGKEKKVKDKKESSKEDKLEKKDKKNILEKLDGMCKTLEKSRLTYVMSRKSLKKRLTFENIYFALTFGLGDAARTGIATGGAWGIAYNLFAIICRVSNVKNHKFNITPDFENETYDMVFEGILTLSPANIICICAVIYRNYRKACKMI